MTILPLAKTVRRAEHCIRVSDLRQWCYCPRVVWWTHVCPVGKVESLKMRMGLVKERRLQRLQRRRTLRGFDLADGSIACNVRLYSPRLRLSGTLDIMIVCGSARYPVEIKFTRGPARLNHRLQLAGYAMLLEDAFGVPVTHGYVVRLPDDTVDHVQIDPSLRQLAEKTISSLRQMFESEQLPPANSMISRCVDCEYRLFCGDVP